MSVSDVLNKFLISLTEREAVFRRLAEHRSVLVILDNVPPTAMVTALQPGNRGMLVVASRSRLRGLLYDGAVEISMRPLNPDDAMTLLSSHVALSRLTGEPETVAELIRFCGGLRGALAWRSPLSGG